MSDLLHRGIEMAVKTVSAVAVCLWFRQHLLSEQHHAGSLLHTNVCRQRDRSLQGTPKDDLRPQRYPDCVGKQLVHRFVCFGAATC